MSTKYKPYVDPVAEQYVRVNPWIYKFGKDHEGQEVDLTKLRNKIINDQIEMYHNYENAAATVNYVVYDILKRKYNITEKETIYVPPDQPPVERRNPDFKSGLAVLIIVLAVTFLCKEWILAWIFSITFFLIWNAREKNGGKFF